MTIKAVTLHFAIGTDDLHDVVCDVMTKEGFSIDLNDDLLMKIFDMLPKHLKALACAWGSGDTEFRDSMHHWLTTNLDKWKGVA